MTAPTHVLHLIDDLSFGGAQKLLAAFADRLPKDRYRMTVCALQPDCQIRKELELRGIEVFCLNRERPGIVSPLRFIAYVYSNIRDVVDICKRRHIDIIHCHLSDAEYIGAVAKGLRRIKTVYATNHYPFLPEGRSKADPRNCLRKILYGFLYNHCLDHVIAVSEDVYKVLQEHYGVKPDNMTIITNGIDIKQFCGKQPSAQLRSSLHLDGDQTVIGTIGRLHFQKGQKFLIAAVRHLVSRGYPVVLLLAGDGTLREELEAQTEACGLQKHIRFLGARSDTAEILALTDIFVFPSLYEGTSLALLEAMAAGKPIVASDIPGTAAVITHGHNGCLVPPADSGALADAVADLIGHPKRAEEFGRRAYQAVQDRFDIKDTIAAHESLWNHDST